MRLDICLLCFLDDEEQKTKKIPREARKFLYFKVFLEKVITIFN